MVHRTAVVILNWNNRNFLEQFLPDVIKYSTASAEVIIADNNSTDDSIAFIENNFPSVKIIKLKSNEGYTGGYNFALQEIDADYFVLTASSCAFAE